MQLILSKKNKKISEKLVLAIGGGSTIDKAKIYAKRNKKILLAIPTTGAGATETTHAVVWEKTKKNIKTDKPITIMPPFKIKLDGCTRVSTICDILGHIIDYLNVCSDNDIVELGIFAGKLIEKHPTNLTHPKSYNFTLKYKVPHGLAVGMVLEECLNKMLKKRSKE